MGEYAIRKSDGVEIKIGTCESMYYLRFEDRGKVSHLDGNVNIGLDTEAAESRFRLPFSDEDDVLPGEYKNHARGERLWKMVKSETAAPDWSEDFTDASTADDPGIIQLRHDCGLLINVPCFHGVKLPQGSDDIGAHWNGKSWFLELYQLRPVLVDGVLRVFPVVHCRFCQHAWRYSWDDVLPYLHGELKTRLEVYAQAHPVTA